MTIVAGIDEAGYGPYLGPLVVSAAAFRTPPELAEANLWEALKTGVSARRQGADGRVVIADSKTLYTSRRGLNRLEEGALIALALCTRKVPGSLRDLLKALGADRPQEFDPYPWYAGRDLPLPAATQADRVASRARRLRRALDRCRAEVVAVQSVPLLAGRFNRILARTDNKSEVTFSALAFLVRRLRQTHRGEVMRVVVDKQGGRSHYGHLLLRYFPEADIEVRSETRNLSKYVLREPGGKTELVFRKHAEADQLTVALASMVSKYVRELMMRLFNEYWQGVVAGLKRTSGYVTDARRFLADLHAAGALDGLDRSLLVRQR